MPNKRYNDQQKDRGNDGGIRPTQRDASSVKAGKPESHKADEPIKITAAPDNACKDNFGFGNKASTRQRRGAADRE
jgi:hypothetical protein